MRFSEPGLKPVSFCARWFPGLKAGASTVIPLRGIGVGSRERGDMGRRG